MSHSHDHSEAGHHHPHAAAQKRGLQRHHLFMILGVGLMLAAMAAYVLSLDESVRPEGPPGEEVPAAAPAAG